MAVHFAAEAAGIVRERWTLVTTPGVNTGDDDSTNDSNTQQVVEMHGIGVVEDFRAAPAREDIGSSVQERVIGACGPVFLLMYP